MAEQRWRQLCPFKTLVNSNRLPGVISQKMELFMVNAVGTINPTFLELEGFKAFTAVTMKNIII
jgi:hypothetical protein